MSEENAPQKERFLQEVEQKLLRRDLDANLLENGLLHVSWNEKPLCSVDRDGIVRFRPADITGPEIDRQLRTVIQTAGHVKEYMRIFERAPALKATGLDDTYKVLADFGDAVLAGRYCKTGAKFVTWEWDFDRQGIHAGHYFMENYEAAKKDFAVRAGLVNEQRLFSDEQLAVIKNACEFALEDDATLSYAEEKQLRSVNRTPSRGQRKNIKFSGQQPSAAGRFLCGEAKRMLFHRRQHTQIALDTSCVVIANILLDHLNKHVLAGEPSAVIAFPFQDAPEALHRAVINAMRHAGHTLRHPRLHKLVVEGTVGVLKPSVAVEQRMRVRIGLHSLVEGFENQWVIVAFTEHVGHNAPVAEV